MTNWSVFVGPTKTGKSTYAKRFAGQAKCSVQVLDNMTRSRLGKLDQQGFVHYLEHNNFAQECICITRSPRVAQEVVATLMKVSEARPKVLVFALPQSTRFALGGLCGVTIDNVLVCSTNQQRCNQNDRNILGNEQDKKKQRCDAVWHKVGVEEYAFV